MLDLEDLNAESSRRSVSAPSWGRIAEYAYDKVDPVLGALGTPKGIPAYKPFNAEGEEFLHNYLGMAGIPVEIVPQFPSEGKTVILTEAASADKDIIAKMKGFMKKGGDVMVTSGFYRAMQDKGIKDIFEMVVTSRKADIDTVLVSSGYRQEVLTTATSVKIPVLTYFTNDSWEVVSTLSYGSGWPLLHHSVYSNGNIYVLTIPDNFSHLYALPSRAIDVIRRYASTGMDVCMEGPSRVALLTYDNGTFAALSFNDIPVEVSFAVKGKGISDIATGKAIAGESRNAVRVNGHPYSGEKETVVKTVIPPHSFRAFKIER